MGPRNASWVIVLGDISSTMNEASELYFGYASSLSVRMMKERGARFSSRECAVLMGYRFTFDCNWKDNGFGFATAVPDEQSRVFGALYACQEGSVANLDREHVSQGHFRRVVVQVERASGATVDAVTYIANEACIVKGLKPSLEYFNTILEGEDILPKDYVEFLRKLKD